MTNPDYKKQKIKTTTEDECTYDKTLSKDHRPRRDWFPTHDAIHDATSAPCSQRTRPRRHRRPLGLLLGLQAADREVVHHLLHLLQIVLEAVEALPQVVVLQVEQSESGAKLAEELGHTERPQVVPGSHAVHHEPGLKRPHDGH